MSFNDRDAALLAAAVYYESGEREDMIPPGYKKVEDCCVPKTGFYCVHYIQVSNCTGTPESEALRCRWP